MSQQIRFFEKNIADYSNPNVSATATEASTFASLALNRSNNSAWVTSGSVDANNTTFTIDFGDARYINTLLLLIHNFKDYSAQYWDGSAWQSFWPAISVFNNTLDTTHHFFNQVLASKVRLIINGTMVANVDKFLHQFIVTKQIGQFKGWPILDVKHTRISTNTKMLSGKINLTTAIGAFWASMSIAVLRDKDDLDLLEKLYDFPEGFLIWLCGGDETQFSSARKGYRLRDLYLVRTTNEYNPKYFKGLYGSGIVVKAEVTEVIS